MSVKVQKDNQIKQDNVIESFVVKQQDFCLPFSVYNEINGIQEVVNCNFRIDFL